MKQTVSFSDFDRAFIDYGRTDNFGYQARKALFEYLEQMEEDTGEEMELDVVALCCEFAEYASALSAAEEYGFEKDEEAEEDEQEEAALDWLRDNTTVIEFCEGVIVQGF